MKNLFKRFLLCLTVFFVLCSSSCLKQEVTEKEVTSDAIKKLDTDVMEHREGELLFLFSIDAFIDRYNGFYQMDKNTPYLRPVGEWQRTIYDDGVQAKHETYYYQFTEDEKVWSLPSISVYVPSDGDYVQKITVNFDDHSYTEQTFQLYESMCYYTLKTLFPEFDHERIIELYTKLNQLAYDHLSNEKYSADIVPYALYYKDGIGVYSHFVIGGMLRICVVPVTQEYLKELETKGVLITEI